MATPNNLPAVDLATARPTNRKLLWTGRILQILMVLFMLMDAIMKLVKPAAVVKGTVQLGFPEDTITPIGIALLISTILYALPVTAVLGAMLLTGYLGGAVCAEVRAGAPVFQCFFPVIFGILIWGGIFLQDARLRAVVPFRRGHE